MITSRKENINNLTKVSLQSIVDRSASTPVHMKQRSLRGQGDRPCGAATFSAIESTDTVKELSCPAAATPPPPPPQWQHCT